MGPSTVNQSDACKMTKTPTNLFGMVIAQMMGFSTCATTDFGTDAFYVTLPEALSGEFAVFVACYMFDVDATYGNETCVH